jgi:hypothetical protein
MAVTRWLKLPLLLATLWIPLYLVWFMVLMVTSMSGAALFDVERTLAIHVATMGLTMLLLVYYVVHVFRSKSVPHDRRVMWLLVLFFGAPVAMPVYWFLHVWPQRSESARTVEHVTTASHAAPTD